MSVSRREFLLGSAAVSALAGCQSVGMFGPNADVNLTAFMSDIHVSGSNVHGQPTYQNPLFEKAVDQILALRPRPARVVVMGDIALWVGRKEDYEASLPGLKRIKEAGIQLYLAMGNHDHRKTFLKYHPEYAKSSPVKDRIVSVVDLGTADLLILDSLNETGDGEGKPNEVGGTLDTPQWNWLTEQVATRNRPFFVGSHHDPSDLGGRRIKQLLAKSKFFVGYIHGHHHRWMADNWMKKSWSSRRIMRIAGLPSTGWWGDIGFALMRTNKGYAELSMAPGNDFFFPHPLKEGEKRPVLWNVMCKEHKGAKCTFIY